jgi:hypothetical protein
MLTAALLLVGDGISAAELALSLLDWRVGSNDWIRISQRRRCGCTQTIGDSRRH